MKELRSKVGLVFQYPEHQLFETDVFTDVCFGPRNLGLSREETESRAKHALKLVGLDESFYRQSPFELSGGQKQRLCIARALLKRPKILILDDSTSAVDTKTDALIRRAFREEIPDTTKIIIAQRVSSIEDADQIIVLEEGQIVGVGTSSELLRTNEIYREVYESQMKGGEENEQ
mgnify:CR=1 FL=1